MLDLLREDGVNVEEMENTIFDGADAACCTLQLDTPPSSETVSRLEAKAKLSQNKTAEQWAAATAVVEAAKDPLAQATGKLMRQALEAGS